MSHYRETQKAIERVFEKQIFFVVGRSKSWTTWLQFLLDAHPQICCKGEGHFADVLYPLLGNAFQRYNKQSSSRSGLFEKSGLKGNFPTYNREHLHYMLRTAIGLLFVQWAGDADVKCIGDKTPEHGSVLDLLDAVIPAAKYIHIIRDGRDVTVATWEWNMNMNPERILKQYGNFAGFVENLAKYWRDSVTQARNFGGAHPNRYFELRYEDLHREPEPIVHAMFQFLGVDAGDDVVTDCIHAASFERLTKGRKRGQEQSGAHMRKGVVGDWRNHFDETSRAIFRRHAGDLLKQLGYDD